MNNNNSFYNPAHNSLSSQTEENNQISGCKRHFSENEELSEFYEIDDHKNLVTKLSEIYVYKKAFINLLKRCVLKILDLIQ